MYRIYVHAKDLAGNADVTGSTNTFLFDTATATPTILAPVAGNVYGPLQALPTISGTAADLPVNSLAGLAQVQVRIRNAINNTYWDGGSGSCGPFTLPTWVDATCPSVPEIWNVTAGTATWSYTQPGWQDGTVYAVVARTLDLAGNLSQGTTASFTYDTTPPVISVERIADELRRMLTSARPRLALELLDAGELLEGVLPEVAACKGVRQTGYHTHDVFGHTLLTVERVPPELVVRLAALFHDAGKPSTATPDGAFTSHEIVGADLARSALERLRFAQKEIDLVVKLVRLHLRPVYYSSEWSDGAVRRLARDAGPVLDRLMSLARADIAASAYPEPEKLDELQQRIHAVLSEQPSRLAPLVTGEDVMSARGIGPGPEVGRIKKRIEELVIDGEVPPTREAVLEYLAGHQDM